MESQTAPKVSVGEMRSTEKGVRGVQLRGMVHILGVCGKMFQKDLMVLSAFGIKRQVGGDPCFQTAVVDPFFNGTDAEMGQGSGLRHGDPCL